MMWWLGSFPCQYSPMQPRWSSGDSSFVASVEVNSESSFSTNFSGPPINAINPGTSCGAYHEYCELVASVTSLRLVPPPKECGLNGVRQLPWASFGRIQPLDGS